MRRRKSGNYRAQTINMNEMLHIILSLQIMFGSRRTIAAMLAVILLCGGGYFAYTYFNNPLGELETADQLWDNDKQVDAVRQYKALLRKRNPLDRQYTALPAAERPRLYRRIITHEAIYATKAEARDWISDAYQEGINFERADFENQEVYDLWLEVTSTDGRTRSLAKEADKQSKQQSDNSTSESGSEKATVTPIAAADRLWDDDKRVEATKEYKRLLGQANSDLTKPQRKTIIGRVIAYEAEYGNLDEARKWMTTAQKEGHDFGETDFYGEVYQLWLDVGAEPNKAADSPKKDNKSALDKLDDILDQKKKKQ